ncbi:MAG: DUF1287 domain-containing protein [Terracidiphilus sp.]|nr:DUF1287 domain-containing protein [Terracidiphilus sp.]MDR3796562.1 DUF1287 domain-containing protein [Terracidiphilus sp.]
MQRRTFLGALAATFAVEKLGWADPTPGERLAAAARVQVGLTTSYDPAWTSIAYPNGDVPRSTGVCADVVVRAARDALGLDLQKLLHEDMMKHFDAYPARKAWGQTRPDANIDHRRVLNLQTYFQRAGAQLWTATGPVPGDRFPQPLSPGDILTWILNSGQPHIGMVVGVPPAGAANAHETSPHVVHNIGRGAEESPLSAFWPHHAFGHYRWPLA